MTRVRTTLIDKRLGEVVDATLVQGVSREIVDQTENRWEQPRLEGALQLSRAGESVPEHYHWNWKRKSAQLELLAYDCFGIECEGVMQGLMMVNTTNHVARLEPDKAKPLVYVDYLESAPWNLKGLTSEPRFGAIGIRLFESTVRFSMAEGFSGRVGLHALPQSENFYTNACGMTRVERDPRLQNLWWYEITAGQAQVFLAKGGTP